MDILEIKSPILKDDSIDEYEYFEYEPITGTNLNNSGGNIRIDIETQDIFYHPSESYLQIIGQLVKNDGNVYNKAAAGDMVTLTNNGLMHLFKHIRYQLRGQEIESINYPGQATTMLGLLKYPDDFSKSQELNQLWYKDTGVNAASDTNTGFSVRRDYIFSSDPVGTFNFRIPLKHIFGFCEDYNKVLYGMKQTLTLTRNDDNDAIFRATEVAAAGGNPAKHEPGKVNLMKVSWFMPHVEPEIGNRVELHKFIEKKEKFPVGYRMIQSDSIAVPQAATGFTWRLSAKSSPEVPRFLIVGFQTGKSGDQEQNPSIFDHLNVKNIYVMLGSKRYPAYDFDINFPANQISRIYGEAALFRKKFFNMDELVSNPNITPSDYKTLFPLFLFDVSKQSEKLKYSVTDIHIKVTFTANPPANTEAYAVLLSDRLINFQIDGNKMSVVY